jgi:hypothetical protein
MAMATRCGRRVAGVGAVRPGVAAEPSFRCGVFQGTGDSRKIVCPSGCSPHGKGLNQPNARTGRQAMLRALGFSMKLKS